MGCDLAGELDDFVDRRGEDDKARGTHSFLWCIGNLGTPGLRAQLLARFRASCPNDDASGESAGVGGFGDGAAKQPGGENRQLVKHRNCKREWSADVEFFEASRAGEIGLSVKPPCHGLANHDRHG